MSTMNQWIGYLFGAMILCGSGRLVYGQFNYSMCEENSICIGLPENCLDTQNCVAIGKVARISSDLFQFDLQTIPDTSQTTSLAYVAIGLSLDTRMDDDSIVECVLSNNTQIDVFMSHTKRSPRSADRHPYTDEITVTDKSYTDGSISCTFERKAVTVIDNLVFDLNQMSIHLLLAIGNGVEVNSLLRHTMRVASSDPLLGPETGEVPNKHIDYDACGVTHTCLGMPNECTTKRNCHTAVTILYTEPTYKFQLFTSSSTVYVAFGLSIDDKMGDDLVVECVRETNAVNMYTSYTRYDAGSDRHFSNGSATLLDSSYVDNVIYCYVERTQIARVFGQEFDLSSQPFHILLAIGDEATTTTLTYHKQRQASSQAIRLSEVVDLSPSAKPLLVILHGCFMIFAWMGTAATGLVLARYFKSEWSNKAVFGKDLWFIGHMTCMVITWTLTLACFVIIFVHVGGWTRIGNVHAILGIVVTLLCFFQPIGALYRPDPKHPRRYLFNIGHYFVGRIVFLLAIVNIFYAIDLSTAEMPIWFLAFMVIFVVVFWGNHILMSIMEYLTDNKRNFLLAFVGPAKRLDYATADYRAWYVRLKMKVFAAYLAAIIALVIGSICVVIFNRN